MILARRLSKSVLTIVAGGSKFVSILTPLPVGNLNDVILPTLSDQLFETSSAVTRSWIECNGGGVRGSKGRSTRDGRDWPLAINNCILTRSIPIQIDSVMVCST